MKFQLISDIHLEFINYFPIIPPNAPYLFLAGDIGKIGLPNFRYFFDYCSQNWKKVFYVLGNHEYYHNHKTHSVLLREYKEFCNQYTNVFLLNNEGTELEENGLKYFIYGSTLWSNPSKEDGINDFYQIKAKNAKNWNVPINLEQFKELHHEAICKLEENLGKENMIIMTHFPPVRRIGKNTTSHPKYEGELQETYFANQLDKKMYKDVKIWISGHTHYSYDFVDGDTRFISNAMGYPDEGVKWDEEKVYDMSVL